MKLPKLIYVTLEAEGALGEYLCAERTAETKDNGSKVGIYELREILTKKVTHSLEKSKK